MNRLSAFALAAVVFAAVIFSGCGGREDASSDDAGTANTAPPLLNIEIDRLVTAQQVEDALGFSVENTVVAEQDTAVRYSSGDMLSFVEIGMMECTREIFDETAALYEDAVDTPNLGQAAKWSAEQNQLMVYNGRYMISLTVSADKSDDQLLVSARQIAALILEKL